MSKRNIILRPLSIMITIILSLIFVVLMWFIGGAVSLLLAVWLIPTISINMCYFVFFVGGLMFMFGIGVLIQLLYYVFKVKIEGW